MNKPISHIVKAGAELLFCVACLMWSTHASADEPQPIVTANAQGRQVVILPALKAEGMRGGQMLLVTERGPEYVKPERLAQQMTLKPTAFAGICTPR